MRQAAPRQAAAMAERARLEATARTDVDEGVGGRRIAQLGRSFGLYAGARKEGPSLQLGVPGLFAKQVGTQLADTCRKHAGMYVKAGRALLALPYAFDGETLDEIGRERTEVIDVE
eukprot:4895482-Prymnesium_polylepis.1